MLPTNGWSVWKLVLKNFVKENRYNSFLAVIIVCDIYGDRKCY